MRIGVLGTGMVGRTIASKLVEVGHEVKMGSRTADKKTPLCIGCCLIRDQPHHYTRATQALAGGTRS